MRGCVCAGGGMLKGEGQETNGLSKDEIQKTNDSNIPMGQMGYKKSIKNQIVYRHPNGLCVITAGKYLFFNCSQSESNV